MPQPDTPIIAKCCAACGSQEVCLDAYASWNTRTQRWELANVYDRGFCRQCEDDAEIVDLTLHRFLAFGCWVAVIDGTLFCCPMLKDGYPETDDIGAVELAEVTEPQGEDFLEAVNDRLGAAFKLEAFAGR